MNNIQQVVKLLTAFVFLLFCTSFCVNGNKEYKGMLSGGIGVNVFGEEIINMNVGGPA